MQTIHGRYIISEIFILGFIFVSFFTLFKIIQNLSYEEPVCKVLKTKLSEPVERHIILDGEYL
jgi:hypothetical protein